MLLGLRIFGGGVVGLTAAAAYPVSIPFMIYYAYRKNVRKNELKIEFIHLYIYTYTTMTYLGFQWSSAYGQSLIKEYNGDIKSVWKEFTKDENKKDLFDLENDETILDDYIDLSDYDNDKFDWNNFVTKFNSIKEKIAYDGYSDDPFVSWYYYLIKTDKKINVDSIKAILIPDESISSTIIPLNKVKIYYNDDNSDYDNDAINHIRIKGNNTR
jgi:hypothetical protein